jgi:hypothetical protein
MRRALTVAGGALLALVPCSAHAAATAHLVYARSTDASSCPDEDALRTAVRARVGYDPFFPWAKRNVVAAITRRGHAFVASVELVDEQGFSHGVHELKTDGECGELLDAVALSIAIAIDPRLLVAPSSAVASDAVDAAKPEPASSRPPPAPPHSAPIAAPPRLAMAPLPPPEDVTPPPARREEVHLEGSATAIVSLGTAPSPTAGLALGADVRWRFLSIGVEGRVDAPAGTGAADGGSVSSWLASGAIVPCAYVGVAFACPLWQVGVVEASGSGVSNERAASLAWFGVGGRVGALVELTGHLFFRIQGELVANLDPVKLELDGASAWTAPGVAGGFGAGVLMRFR